MSVVQKFDADTGAVERALEKVQQKYDALLHRMKKMGETSQQGSDIAMAGFDKLGTTLTNIAAGYISLQSTVEVLNREYERQIRLQEKIHGTNMTVAQSQGNVIKMMGNATQNDVTKFFDKLNAIQTASKFSDIVPINQAAGNILSATGGDREVTAQILAAAAPLFRDDPSSLPMFGGAVGDIMSATGGTAQESAALALAGTQGARIENLGAFKHVASAVMGAQAHTGLPGQQSAEEMMAMFGTLSRRTGDAEGSQTKTAVLRMSKVLEEFGGEGNTLERLTRVQEELAAGRIKESALIQGFEGSSQGIARMLFRGDATVNEDLRKTIASTKASPEAYRQLVSNLDGGTPQLQMFAMQSASEAAVQQAALSPGGATDALLEQGRKVHDTALDSLGRTSGAHFRIPIMDRMYGPIDEINMKLERLERTRGYYADREAEGQAPTARDQSDMAMLDRQIALLREIRDNLRTQRQSDPRTAASTQAERD